MNWVALGFIVLGVLALLLIIGTVAYTKMSFVPGAEYGDFDFMDRPRSDTY